MKASDSLSWFGNLFCPFPVFSLSWLASTQVEEGGRHAALSHVITTLFFWFWELNPGPCLCQTSAFAAELYPQHKVITLAGILWEGRSHAGLGESFGCRSSPRLQLPRTPSCAQSRMQCTHYDGWRRVLRATPRPAAAVPACLCPVGFVHSVRLAAVLGSTLKQGCKSHLLSVLCLTFP